MPLKKQLLQGVSAEKLSWAVAVGCVMGVFPIMGTTSLVTLFAAWVGKLNKPVTLVFSKLMLPLHLLLILVFIRLGQRLHGVPLLSFSIPELLAQFKASPMQFARDYSLAAWHGVVAWALVGAAAVYLLRLVSLPVLRKLANGLSAGREVSA